MAIWMHTILLALPLTFIVTSEAATPLFLQAITSALATIPFTGGPMTTGLVGAKLGIGAKLLYYLGFFGRRSRPTRSKVKSAAKSAANKNRPSPTGGSQSFSGVQPVPLPYMFSGGGFPGMGNNFQQAPTSHRSSAVDPAQLFQILTSQGVDPNTVMEALNYAGASGASAGFGASSGFPTSGFGAGGFGASGGLPTSGFGAGGFGASGGLPTSGFGASGGSAGFGAGGFGGNAGFGPGVGAGSNAGFGANGLGAGFGIGGGNPGFGTSGGANMNPGFGMGSGFSTGQNENSGASQPGSNVNTPSDKVPEEGGSEDDVESFFTFMQDMDENTCISRLICDIGHDPSFLGDFSENIHSMVNSLEVKQSSRAYQYIEIMEMGRKSGNCDEKFPECSDMSYDIVKNVAPSVSLPQNVNLDAINSL